MNILFIGNSHTYYHDMPRKVALLGLRDGVDCHTVMIAHGGWRLSQHVKEADVKFNVKYGMYDFIIIQDHSYPIEFIEEFKEGVSTLATMARNVGSIPLLYETWTRVDDEKNQIKIHKLHEEVAEKNKIRLIPVGKYWWEFSSTHPSIDMYEEDGIHASDSGMDFVARCIWNTLIEIKNPV